VAINPNSKIPALMDHSGETPIRIFESAAILTIWRRSSAPSCRPSPATRAECLSWVIWQMGSAPYLGGGFGHFYAYAPFKIEYPIDRFAMEVKRQLDVLDRRLAESEYHGRQRLYDRRYRHLAVVRQPGQGPAVRVRRVPVRCTSTGTSTLEPTRSPRPAVKRGRMVNRVRRPGQLLHERHEASDFETRRRWTSCSPRRADQRRDLNLTATQLYGQ
jgi:GST-like protein